MASTDGAAKAWYNRLRSGIPGSIGRVPAMSKSPNPGTVRSILASGRVKCGPRSGSWRSSSPLVTSSSNWRQPEEAKRRHAAIARSANGVVLAATAGNTIPTADVPILTAVNCNNERRVIKESAI